jgi:hypothetical protein
MTNVKNPLLQDLFTAAEAFNIAEEDLDVTEGLVGVAEAVYFQLPNSNRADDAEYFRIIVDPRYTGMFKIQHQVAGDFYNEYQLLIETNNENRRNAVAAVIARWALVRASRYLEALRPAEVYEG